MREISLTRSDRQGFAGYWKQQFGQNPFYFGHQELFASVFLDAEPVKLFAMSTNAEKFYQVGKRSLQTERSTICSAACTFANWSNQKTQHTFPFPFQNLSNDPNLHIKIAPCVEESTRKQRTSQFSCKRRGKFLNQFPKPRAEPAAAY